MTKKEHEAFLKAVDLVCINCVCMNEETCKGCPVRKSVDCLQQARLMIMANLAEQLKGELNNEFLQIRDELNEYVKSQIEVSGTAYVGSTGRSDKLIETEQYGMQRGIKKISKRLFDAARTYYREQGFYFRLDYSPMGTILRGFFVSIID